MPHSSWLITGASGQLGGHVVAELRSQAPAGTIVGISHSPAENPGIINAVVDLADPTAIAAVLVKHRPTHIIHLAAVTAVADAWRDPQRATAVNTDATAQIADWANQHSAKMLFVSTDMVFDGETAPYDEDDEPQPLSCYGRTKAAAERAICELPGALIVRLPLMYGFPAAPRETTFVKQVAALRAGEPLTLFTDEYRTPISLIDAARALLALATSDVRGVIHVAGPERMSRYEMGVRFASALDIPHPNLIAASRLTVEAAEPRAADLSLDGERFTALFPALAPRPIGRATLGTSAV
jgi:dTDP-4-dehydrorhamnose reductase